MNPDEAVAHGTAIQAAVLAGENPDMLKQVLMLDAVGASPLLVVVVPVPRWR